MNKQIVEFDLQAKDYAAMELAESGQGGIARFNQLYRDKFAELIVKECAEVADNADATREKWQSIGKFVKEHFGVE